MCSCVSAVRIHPVQIHGSDPRLSETFHIRSLLQNRLCPNSARTYVDLQPNQRCLAAAIVPSQRSCRCVFGCFAVHSDQRTYAFDNSLFTFLSNIPQLTVCVSCSVLHQSCIWILPPRPLKLLYFVRLIFDYGQKVFGGLEEWYERT